MAPVDGERSPDTAPSPGERFLGVSKLLARISRNTGKTWPEPNRILSAGGNGIAFLIENSSRHPRVLKITHGNASREIYALNKLTQAGANFVPKLSKNYVAIRKANNDLKRYLFSQNSIKQHPAGLTAYVMNKVGKTTLWRYVKGGQLSNWGTVRPHKTNNNRRQIRQELVKAIKFMHAHGISHGDLHSGNILVELGPTGNLKKLWIIDFGRYINIPNGQTENNAYRNLNINSVNKNTNIFNTGKKPKTTKYLAYNTISRRNTNMLKAMGFGNIMNENIKASPSPRCGMFGCLPRRRPTRT
jgi:RIO-like serine/threonine protein kinase